MDKKSKILLSLLIIAVITSIAVTYYKTIVRNDFEVITDQDISE